jgi:Ni/Co efflux regulator RcnB
MQAIHGDLARQLPHPPHGTRYTYYNDQVLLIDLNTRVVLDFINISVSAGF